MPQSNTSDATQDNYCIPCGDVFFLRIGEDYFFGNDVFFLRIDDDSFFGDMFFLGIEISDTCGFSFATDNSADV